VQLFLNTKTEDRPMNDEIDPVREWAKVKSALREASDRVLNVEGHTWQSLKELEAQAIAQLAGQAYADNEYGTVQVVEKPVYAHKNSVQIDTTHYLRLNTREAKNAESK
jgi:septum formation inhibitor MinC